MRKFSENSEFRMKKEKKEREDTNIKEFIYIINNYVCVMR